MLRITSTIQEDLICLRDEWFPGSSDLVIVVTSSNDCPWLAEIGRLENGR